MSKIYRGTTPVFEYIIKEHNLNTNSEELLNIDKATISMIIRKPSSKIINFEAVMEKFIPIIDGQPAPYVCAVKHAMTPYESYNLDGKYKAQLEIVFKKEDTGTGADAIYIKDLEDIEFEMPLKPYANLKSTILHT